MPADPALCHCEPLTTRRDAPLIRLRPRLSVPYPLCACAFSTSGCRSSNSAPGVDLQRDERVARANECYAAFKAIYDTAIAPIAKRDSPIGELAKDTRAHLEKLLWTKP